MSDVNSKGAARLKPVPEPAPRRTGHREALLEAAIQCIQQKGYARTTARDLVAVSGTNLASIGYHFGSKDELLNEAIAEAFRRWLVKLATVAVLDEDAAPLDRLRASLTAWSETFEENQPFLVGFVEALAQSAHTPELREQIAAQYAETREAVAAIVRELLSADGATDQDVDADAIASILIAVIDGMMLQWMLEPEKKMSGEEVLGAFEDAVRVVSQSA